MTAIENKKPLICLGKGFNFDLKVDVNGRKYHAETVVGVAADFQCYARAIPICLEILGWATQNDNRDAALRCIVRKFVNGKEDAKKLRDTIEQERNYIASEGLCIPAATTAAVPAQPAPALAQIQPLVPVGPDNTTRSRLENAQANLVAKQAANFTAKLATEAARTRAVKAEQAHAAAEAEQSKSATDSAEATLSVADAIRSAGQAPAFAQYAESAIQDGIDDIEVLRMYHDSDSTLKTLMEDLKITSRPHGMAVTRRLLALLNQTA